MDREKGLAYCGLACCVCGERDTCDGCRQGGCSDHSWCKNFACCQKKGLSGCWECPDFPCEGGMLDKLRIRAFASFIRENGEEAMFSALEKNERLGVVYHQKGQLTGDYDRFATEEEIKNFLRTGIRPE